MEAIRTDREPGDIEAGPGSVAHAGKLIHEGLGGRRGDFSTRKGVIAGNLLVKVADTSRDNSWTHTRNQTWLTFPQGVSYEFRAMDGGSGADDPEQELTVISRDTHHEWSHFDGDPPEWVGEELEALALARDELGSETE